MLKDQGQNAQVFFEKKGLRAENRKFFVKFQAKKKKVMTLAHF